MEWYPFDSQFREEKTPGNRRGMEDEWKNSFFFKYKPRPVVVLLSIATPPAVGCHGNLECFLPLFLTL